MMRIRRGRIGVKRSRSSMRLTRMFKHKRDASPDQKRGQDGEQAHGDIPDQREVLQCEIDDERKQDEAAVCLDLFAGISVYPAAYDSSLVHIGILTHFQRFGSMPLEKTHP